MAEWGTECSSDSESENLFVAISKQFKSKDLKQVLSSLRDKEAKLECLKNIKRKKLRKKVNVVGEVSKQEHDVQASESTPTDMNSPPLSTSIKELQHTQQQQRHNLSAFDYNDDFPALVDKQKRSPVIKKQRKVVAQLDQVMSNFARHKRLEEQQMRFGGQEVLQQRLHPPIQPAAVVANNKRQSTIPQADLSFDSDSDEESLDREITGE